MKKTGIMTDSHSGILPEEAERLGIRVLPMPFYIGEKLYREGVDLSRDEFYDMLRKGVDVSTSQPSPAEVIDMWKEMLKEYEEIVYIPLSSALSGSCMAAAAMADSFGVPMEVIRKVLEQFQAVEHRIEYVVEKRGVKFYNDSKGTNPDAAIQGIRAMERPTFLIGGGYDKQSEYDEWIEAFDGKVKQLVLIGQTREKIADCAKKHGFTEIAFADSLEEAMDICYQNAVDGDAILLSPACASWGMFDNYEQRGEKFKEYARNLKE